MSYINKNSCIKNNSSGESRDSNILSESHDKKSEVSSVQVPSVESEQSVGKFPKEIRILGKKNSGKKVLEHKIPYINSSVREREEQK